MSFLLKIVEGPNKGAEIALVDGLCISMGKADSCDIILADPTLPDEPLQIEASSDGVSLEAPGEGRHHLEPSHVVTFGSTSFAIGPAESAWSALVWPKKDEPKEEAPAESQASEPVKNEEKPAEKEEKKDEKKKGGWLLPVIILVVLILLILGLLGWLFRGKIAAMFPNGNQDENVELSVAEAQASALDALVERYSLSRNDEDGRTVLVGNFKTRTERLTATAEAYATQPGIDLDFADAESLKSAVEETLALVGEKSIAVANVTNRVAVLTGKAANLRLALEAIAADVPKLANVECSAITSDPSSPMATAAAAAKPTNRKPTKPSNYVDFPVCGIVTNPYPCLVMRNGMRIMEGASIGENVIVKIEADKVTITNSAGRVIWKP